MAVQLVIFDCDGVLFASGEANVAFYNEVLRRCGQPELDDDGEAACHALASAQLFEKYYGDRPELLARLRETANAMDYGPFYPLMRPHEGLYEFLSALRQRYKTAMATNRGKTVGGVLDYFQLEPYFDLAVGVHDVERPKPHPDMLLKCARHFSLEPREAVYVGDQPGDAASAAAAGMSFIAMGDAVRDARDVVSRLEQIVPLIERL